MSLSASPTAAAANTNYFADNYTALLQAGTAVPPSYTAPTLAFEAWKNANNGANNKKEFYLEKSGDSYKLGSVSSGSVLPKNSVAVDLNVAYGIESKEMSLVDWMMSRIGDEIRQANAVNASGSLLSLAPEADLGIDSSSMSQSDLALLLKRLGRATSDLKTTTALGNLSDRSTASAALGLTASLLGAALEQQRLFGEEAATLSTGTEAQAVGSAQSGLKDAKATLDDAKATLTTATATLTTATATRDGAQTTLNGKLATRDDAFAALEAAKAPGSKASEAEVKQLQATYDQTLADVTTAQTALTLAQTALDGATTAVAGATTAVAGATTAVAQAETAVTQAKDKYEAADNFNEVMSAALAKLVAEFTEDLAAAQLAYSETAASTVSTSQLSGLTSAAGGALNSRLRSAADLALLTNPAISLFSALDVQQTDDGYVLNTAALASRQTQVATVRAALVEALNDPALQTALADAMAASADSLGTAGMALPDQTRLYNEVAGAVIAAMLSNDAYLDETAGGAVDFGNQLGQMLGNELISASKRDATLSNA